MAPPAQRDTARWTLRRRLAQGGTCPWPTIESTPELVQNDLRRRLTSNLEIVRERLGRPLTYAEKILLGHLDDPRGQELEPGDSYLLLRPDRVAMQDATAQMALLQFMQAGRDETAVPVDGPLRPPDPGLSRRKDADMETARTTNAEVYNFLRTCSGALRHRLLGPRRGHHPSGRAREVRLPGRHDDRHRLAYARTRVGSACSPAASAGPTRST